MARSNRLVILIKNIYTLWGRKRFHLPVTYFPTNLVYPFTLRVTGIKRKNAIVEYLDYQIPVTQLRSKGNGGQILALWALDWALETFFLNQSIGIDETNTFQLKMFI